MFLTLTFQWINCRGENHASSFQNTTVTLLNSYFFVFRLSLCKFAWILILNFSVSRCDESDCHGLLRPNVVFFGETLDSHILTKVEKEMEICDLCLVVSFIFGSKLRLTFEKLQNPLGVYEVINFLSVLLKPLLRDKLVVCSLCFICSWCITFYL